MAAHRTNPATKKTKLISGVSQCRNPECWSLYDVSLKKDDGLCPICRDKLRGDDLDHRKKSTKDYGSATVNAQYGAPKCPICLNPILDCNCPPSVGDADFSEWNAGFATGKARSRKKKHALAARRIERLTSD